LAEPAFVAPHLAGPAPHLANIAPHMAGFQTRFPGTLDYIRGLNIHGARRLARRPASLCC